MMQNQYTIFKIMERVWLTCAVAMLLWGAWYLSKGDWDQAKFPLFVSFCCGILFALRRYQRRKLGRAMEEKNRKTD
jgi:hypothetical protein